MSGVAVVGLSRQDQSDARSYRGKLYYSHSDIHSWEVYFVITRNMELHISAVDARFTKNGAIPGPDQEVIFEEEQITLDIPEEGVVLAGWRIIPHSYPRITKRQVDSFEPAGGLAPFCQLHVEWTGEQEQRIGLNYRVNLLGAKEPNNFLSIRTP